MISAKKSNERDLLIKKENQFLAEKNPHPRDKNVYNVHLTGVTKLCVFKYPYGTTNEGAMLEGTMLHNDIETYYNTGKSENDSKEFTFFKKFATASNLEPYRTEWLIYSEYAKIIGTIDMVFKNENDTYSIYDWKRTIKVTANTDDCRRYTLQLNLYRYILESVYHMTIEGLYLLLLHPENENYIEIPIIREEISNLDIKKIIQELSDSKFKKHRYSDIDSFIGYSCQDSTSIKRLAMNSKSRKLVVDWRTNEMHQFKKFPQYLEQMIVDGEAIGSIETEIRIMRYFTVIRKFPDILSIDDGGIEESESVLNFGSLKIS